MNITEGLIYTNDNCVGCNKCISVCSCPGATIATESVDGKNIIKIDGSRCIACGACFDACEHQAREYVDDSARFFEDLIKGEDISVMFAPAFVANYPKEYKQALGKLKALGVNKIFSVSFGADITTWAYLNYIEKHNFRGAISQPCPATVDYIEKYIPELIPKLMPVQSPMMCAAIYAKKHMNIQGKLAFIGPCIAKKNEIESKRGLGLISYNVTFDHMMKHLRTVNVCPVDYEIETESGLGAVYPMPGGLAENIYWFLGEQTFIRQVVGEKQMYQYLEDNKDRILSQDSEYDMVDVLNCSDGCLCGTGVETGLIDKEDIFIQIQKIKSEVKSGETGKLSPKERYDELNNRFSMLSLEDYVCEYTDKSAECEWKKITEEELEQVFELMNKTTKEDREINCSCCGYDNCVKMAEAIYNGFNHKENCIHFIKDMLEEISTDCPTVLLIHEKNQSVHVVKYTGETAIRGWIDSGINASDYNQSIKDYIARYVDASDRERVWSEVEFTSLMENLSKDGHFIISYIRHPENGHDGYFQLEFVRLSGRDDIVLTFRDVDDTIKADMKIRKELQDALDLAKQASKTKSTFLANMSHEIRTPINAIIGMDTMILRESNQENVLEYARNVKSASATLLSLINDILDFSKIESGKMEIIEANYRLDSVINDVMNIVRGKAQDKGLDLKLIIMPETPAQLYGDEIRIKQVILNLLNNAIKYTNEGEVVFEVGYEEFDKDRTKLCVAIRDTGVGIKEEDMSVLFSPYERIEENENKYIEGTGLGLSITKSLLTKMNSEVQVASEYGVGSTFAFKIDQSVWGEDRISQEHLSYNETADDEENQELYHTRDAKILVVDDVEMNITVVRSLLKRIRIDMDTCLSGQEAIELAKNNKYDIIFLDAMMPEMNGEETLQHIRSTSVVNGDTPIIVLTANAIVGAREKYIQSGFTDYMSKPLNGIKLERLIKKYLLAEKVVTDLNKSDMVADEDGIDSLACEDKLLYDKLSKVQAISRDNGIKATGDILTYISVVKNFYITAQSRIEQINDFYSKKDIENYTIQVHALKSSSRLVGADELSQLAFELEKAGIEKNLELIEGETKHLLDMYKALIDSLREAVANDKKDDGKKELSDKKFRRRMSDLLELIEAFDYQTAKELFGTLDEYKLTNECVGVYERLRSHMAEVNRDTIIDIINEYLGRKKDE